MSSVKISRHYFLDKKVFNSALKKSPLTQGFFCYKNEVVILHSLNDNSNLDEKKPQDMWKYS